jgi:LacI family transcriptional regulator
MRDVAKLAKVATMTVSRVLNGSAPVTDETRERVHQAIRQLNYKPDPVARSLRQAKSNSIGLIVPNFYDPFFAICAHTIGLVAKKYKYSVNVTTSDEDTDLEFSEASMMVLHHVEGLAVIPASIGKSRLNRSEFHSTHIVTLDRPVKGHRFNSVLVENRKGARIAVEHLIEHGHTRIAYLGLADKLYTLDERYQGYCDAMTGAGLSPGKHFTGGTEEVTCALIRRELARIEAPTAFFMGNNLMMRQALHAFLQLGVAIPEDIAIVGFDDFEMADIFRPSLTVVRQPAHELGRIAAELLFARLTAKEVSLSGEQIILPVELIVRESCGCKPANVAPKWQPKQA